MDPVIVDLVTSDTLHDKSMRYEALSYSWGRVSATVPIEVLQEGSTEAENVSISISLNDALRHLRYQDKERVLWVDQLCINQRAGAETAHQVSMMGEVYSQSDKAVVWLGGGNEETLRSLFLIKSLFSHTCYISDEESYNAVIRAFFHDAEIKPENPGAAVFRLLQSLSQVFSLPWFWRVWVLQEAFLAPRVTLQYGDDIFQWNCLINANHWMNHRFGLPGVQLVNLPYPWVQLDALNKSVAVSKGVTASAKIGLLDLVLQGLDMKATDPRDKIFGLLGLADETSSFRLSREDWLIYPDYEKSVSETFTDFTRWWIEQNQSLKILSAVHGNHGRTWQSLHSTCSSRVPVHDAPPANHPSWALWHSGKFKWTKESLGFRTPTYKASSNSKAVLIPVGKRDPARWRLELQGKKLGAILSMGSTNYDPDSELIQTFYRIFDISGKRRTWNDPFSGLSAWWDYDHKADLIKDDPSINPGDIHVLKLDHGDCFCTIENDLNGMCPIGAQVGDIIVLLRGGPVPYILRRKPNSDNYAFIGECYVQGRMDGSTYNLVDTGTVEEEDFTLV